MSRRCSEWSGCWRPTAPTSLRRRRRSNAFGSSFRSCSAVNLVGAPNGSMTTSCSSVLKTSTPISRGSKPHFHQRRSRRRDRGPIDQACRRICPARTCGSISSIKRAPAKAARLLNRAREKLVRLAKLRGVALRQSYARVGKFALIQHQRYAHAKQFKRANRMLRKLRTYLGRVIRDIGRKIEGNGGLEAAFAKLLLLARRVREQQQRQRGPKVYSLHAPEVECIGKGKAHRPYEFGVKVSVATTLKHCKGGQFVTHVKALPGNPYDGHTLATVIPDMEALVGSTIARILADKGYRGHNAPPDYKFRVFLSDQKRGVTPAIKRELRRRSAVEPVIGHLKAEHRMGRNYLWFQRGDANNAVLAAVGYNFRRLIRWLRLLLCQFLTALLAEPLINPI